MLHKKKLFFISKKIQLIQRSNNQQCHPLHLGSKQYKQLPQKKISKKGKGKRRRESANEREKEKEKKKKEEKGKEEKKKEEKMERAVLKIFFFSTPPPLNAFPSTAPSLDVAREQHNSHKGGTREKHNSYKQKTIGTKR